MAWAAEVLRGSAGAGKFGRHTCVAIALSGAMLLAGCDKNNNNPAAPTPTEPAPAATFAISGTVTGATGALQNARVEVTNQPNAGRFTTTDPSGRYLLNDLKSGSIVLQVSAPGHVMQTASLSLESDKIVDFSLPIAQSLPSVVGRVVDALTRAGLGGVTVTGNGGSCSSDATGKFTLVDDDGGFPQTVSFARSGFVERQTWLNDAGEPTVSMIPSSLNLRAFDEMLRSPVLRRWRQAPRLVLDTRVVQYADLNAASAAAIDDTLTNAEVDSVRSDLEWALGRLTSNTFTAFQSFTRQDSPASGPVSLLNTGQITVVRMAGLTQATGYWGYGRYLTQADGTVTAGLIVLDRDFEKSGSVYRRSLRAHELGHALGYAHVTGVPSVMESSGRTEPTPFDLDAFRVAFQRLPGNRSPDIDPDPSMAPMQPRGAGWSGAIR